MYKRQYQYNPRSNQETHNEMLENLDLYEELILSNNKDSNQEEQTLTRPQDFPLTQTEQLPSTTTPVEQTQNESKIQVNSEVLQNLMSTLPPELSQILAMAIQQLPSESNLLDLVSMMNSLTDEEITDSQLESLEDLFE